MMNEICDCDGCEICEEPDDRRVLYITIALILTLLLIALAAAKAGSVNAIY